MSLPLQKKEITRKHRQECIKVVERIYGEDPVMNDDLIFINFFALVTPKLLSKIPCILHDHVFC